MYTGCGFWTIAWVPVAKTTYNHLLIGGKKKPSRIAKLIVGLIIWNAAITLCMLSLKPVAGRNQVYLCVNIVYSPI